jgi:hypothetical protein
VLPSFTSKPNKLGRIISVAALLFVVLLPLHVHFSAAPQISKECSCIQGTRTQLALAADTWNLAPIYRTTYVITQDDLLWVDERTKLQPVRGPPASLSLS